MWVFVRGPSRPLLLSGANVTRPKIILHVVKLQCLVANKVFNVQSVLNVEDMRCRWAPLQPFRTSISCTNCPVPSSAKVNDIHREKKKKLFIFSFTVTPGTSSIKGQSVCRWKKRPCARLRTCQRDPEASFVSRSCFPHQGSSSLSNKVTRIKLNCLCHL